jgi:hypothetical protein
MDDIATSYRAQSMRIRHGIAVTCISILSWACSQAPLRQAPPVQQAVAIPAMNTPRHPPAPDGKPMQFWSEPIPGTHAEVIFVRNNTDEAMYYRDLELYECNGVVGPCGVDPQRVTVASGDSVQARIVRAQDASGFFYKVKLVYGYSDTQSQ